MPDRRLAAGRFTARPKSRKRGLPYDELLDVETTVLADFLKDPRLLPKRPPGMTALEAK